MEQLICEKCGREISNDFGVTLSFCTNCGAAVSNLSTDRTVEAKSEAAGTRRPKNNLLTGLVVGAAVTLFLLGGGLLFFSGLFSQKETGSGGNANPQSSPWIKFPGFGSVDASEINEVAFSSWQHKGLLTSGDGYVESHRVTFNRDGSAVQTVSINYDSGEREDVLTTFKASVTNEQFQRLAQAVVKNDFFKQTDSPERISEGENVLTVKYSGGEKQIKTSNIDRDTAEIKAVLNEISYMQAELRWNAAN